MFNIGSMNLRKGMTKREQEEAKKKASTTRKLPFVRPVRLWQM